MESVKKEIGDLGHAGPYRPPVKLRKRSEFSSKGPGDDGKVYEANEYVSALGSAVLQGDYCVWILYCKWPHTVIISHAGFTCSQVTRDQTKHHVI